MGDGHVQLEHSSSDDGWIARWLAQGPEHGWGVRAVEILPDNVGYLALSSFWPLDRAAARLSAAFELLRDTRGLVLDLRRNGGGDVAMADAVLASFLAPGAPWPLRLEGRAGPVAMAHEPAPPWTAYGAHRPLVVLVDARTFSAPEAIAYALQAEGRAVVVGQPSGGGAHQTTHDGRDLPGGYRISAPDVRPVAIRTGSNWERVGVVPEIAAGDDAAQIGAQLVRERLRTR